MAYPADIENTVRELKTSLTQIRDIDARTLARTQELGESLSFAEHIPLFQRTFDLFRALDAVRFEVVPPETLREIQSAAGDILGAVDMIRRSSPGSADGHNLRSQILSRFTAGYRSHFQLLAPVLGSAAYASDAHTVLREATELSLLEIRREASAFESGVATSLEQATATLDEARRTAADFGVAVHAKHFEAEASDALKRSRTWLVATVVLWAVALVVAGVSLWSLMPRGTPLAPSVLFPLAVTRILIFSALYSAAVWTGRLYKAQWHNVVVNRHRRNALGTFQLFSTATDDSVTKNAVLLQVTQSIFAQQPTAFVSSESEPTTPPQVFEIVRGVVGGKP